MFQVSQWRFWRYFPLLVLLVQFLPGPALPADILKRKNIDNLTPAELSAYEHAFQILKDRSAKNPYDKSGYLWQAWVHNCPMTWVPSDGKPDGREPGCDFWLGRDPPDPGKYVKANPGHCEHSKDLFLTWHRAQFYYFEKVLQGTDPDGTIKDSRGQTGPSTRTVTVPYWNWTRPPSGNRYPRAFEPRATSEPKSPLYHDNRAKDPIAPGAAYPYTSRHLIAYMIHFQDWPTFGGREMEKGGGAGSLEAAAHNPMHSEYTAGDMADPKLSALDPVFYSFHAYIDLLLEQWIEVHGANGITSKEFFLRADQPQQIIPPPGFTAGTGKPSMGQVKLYLDIKKLGYEYEVRDEDRPVGRADLAKILGLEDQRDPPVFGEATRGLVARLLANGGFKPNPSPTIVRTVDITIPSIGSISNRQIFRAQFNRNPHEPDVSYQIDVYIYPRQTPFEPANQEFRDRYIAAIPEAHWGTGSVHHHDPIIPARPEVTRSILDLINNGRSGETWRMSTGVTVLPLLTTFGDPAMVAEPPLH